MTYLYNTLHYYEPKLRDKKKKLSTDKDNPSILKKKLVNSITDALKSVRPAGWALTQV